MNSRVTNYDDVAQMLHDMLLSEYTSIKLIICRTRESFLKQVLACPESIIHPDITDAPDEGTDLLVSNNPFTGAGQFRSTLATIAGANKIRMAFCPSIDSLRAYLATIPYRPTSEQSLESPKPLLLVVDAVSLHFATSEFSVQGLSRTFALAVEIAARLKMPLIFSEIGNPRHPESVSHGSRLWSAEVPLLSDSIKMGAGSENWTRTSVPIESVAKRWFHFAESN